MGNEISFDNTESCKHLIALLMDGYIPYQLEEFSEGVMFEFEAVNNLKESDIKFSDLTANTLYRECCQISIDRLANDIYNEYFNMQNYASFDNNTYACVKQFTKNPNYFVGNLFEIRANGSQDSGIYVINDNFTSVQVKAALRAINEVNPDIFDRFQKNVGYLEGLNELIEPEHDNEKDITDDF